MNEEPDNKEPDYEEMELRLEREINSRTLAVRRDCAFCGRERSRADDNHAPDCPYWDYFG